MGNEVTLTEDDEGKSVVDANGESVGRVVSVEHGEAHVDPDPGLTDGIRSKLGWGDSDEDSYRLDTSNIETISDDELRLNR